MTAAMYNSRLEMTVRDCKGMQRQNEITTKDNPMGSKTPMGTSIMKPFKSGL